MRANGKSIYALGKIPGIFLVDSQINKDGEMGCFGSMLLKKSINDIG